MIEVASAPDDLRTREWTVTHYEARITRADGMIFSKLVTMPAFGGWADIREKADAEVRSAAANAPPLVA